MTKEKFNIMKINNIDSKKNLSKFCQIFCRTKFLTEMCFANLTEMIINELNVFLMFFAKFSVKTNFAFLHFLTEYKKIIINMLDVEKTKKHSVKIFSNSHAQVVLSGKNWKIFQKTGKFLIDKMSLLFGRNLKNFA